MNYTIKDLRDKKVIIFEAIMGSRAYGTNTPESDTDIRGVFVQPAEDVYKYGYVEQVSDKTNDVTFYELGRFVHLLIGNNPNILELLSAPKDCVVYRDPMFKLLENHKSDFLTKRVRWTFAGYAIEQIKKARGYNKKMNWEENTIIRKTVLDFCYVLEDSGSIQLWDWIKKYNGSHTFGIEYPRSPAQFGLAKIDHAHDMYAMYDLYSHLPNIDFIPMGIVSDPQKSNDVQLVSIPKEDLKNFAGYLTFNKDAYSIHCKKFKEYQTWLKERNPNRFKMNKEHGKNYDSKNMMHVYRLLSMAHELAKGELRVRRTPEEIEKLMKIRRGEYEYANLLSEAEEMIDNLDAVFEVSTLPNKVDEENALNLLLKMRQYFYGLSNYYKA